MVPLSKLLASLTDGESLPPNAVVITIDDAYRSIYKPAYPKLRQYGFPFTVFVGAVILSIGYKLFEAWLNAEGE